MPGPGARLQRANEDKTGSHTSFWVVHVCTGRCMASCVFLSGMLPWVVLRLSLSHLLSHCGGEMSDLGKEPRAAAFCRALSPGAHVWRRSRTRDGPGGHGGEGALPARGRRPGEEEALWQCPCSAPSSPLAWGWVAGWPRGSWAFPSTEVLLPRRRRESSGQAGLSASPARPWAPG